MTKRVYRKYKLLRFYQEDLWGHLTINFFESLRKLRQLSFNSFDNDVKDKKLVDSSNALKLKNLKVSNYFFNDIIIDFLYQKKDKIRTNFEFY